MSNFIENSIKSMSKAIYIRHIVLICLLLALPMVIVLTSNPPFYMYVYYIVSTLLYPYARFAYENSAGYILGNNIFILPLPLMLLLKAGTMVLCWSFSIIIAPISLALLYYYNTKHEN